MVGLEKLFLVGLSDRSALKPEGVLKLGFWSCLPLLMRLEFFIIKLIKLFLSYILAQTSLIVIRFKMS